MEHPRDVTDVRSFDWRYSWTREALEGLDASLQRLAVSQRDGLDMLEHAETLVGLGYVALQAYLSSALSDLKVVVGAGCPGPRRLRSERSAVIPGTVLSFVQVIWAAANYFKHHDEWPSWAPDGKRKDTVEMLAKVGISERSEFPCSELLRLLRQGGWDLAPLADVVSEWREAWFAALTPPTV
jgi:hypothetical protein